MDEQKPCPDRGLSCSFSAGRSGRLDAEPLCLAAHVCEQEPCVLTAQVAIVGGRAVCVWSTA